MRVAITYDMETGNVFQHFGHTKYFKVYDIEDGKIIRSAIYDNGGFGHHSLPVYLKEMGVEVIILGNRGQGAINAINNAGLKQFAGVTGNADEAAQAFLAGTLVHNEDAKCNHHHEHHEENEHTEQPKFKAIK